ncbi:efflux RND transporter permease subunit, partial [Streptococcus pneumoniae]|uniref:efflux RND transporter permease subunit n=1 Tax=Streptococcus pneumoniae TaxID=1313 RepID=UPI0013D988F5
TLRVATQGDYDNALPKLSLDTRQVPIVTRLSHEDKQSLTTLSNLYVPSSKAVPVQIKDVASLKFTTGEASISRLDRERAIKITVLPTKDASLGDLIDRVKSTQIIQTLPEGIHLIDEGQAEDMAELFT